MATSRIPAAIDALVALFTAAMPDEVAVSDGPVVEGVYAADVLAVGAGPDPEAATATQRAAAIGAQRREEQFEVACSVSTYQPTTAEARDRAFALFGLAEDALRSTPTLDPGTQLVRFAEVTSYALIQRAGEDGPYAAITFTVSCSARI